MGREKVKKSKDRKVQRNKKLICAKKGNEPCFLYTPLSQNSTSRFSIILLSLALICIPNSPLFFSFVHFITLGHHDGRSLDYLGCQQLRPARARVLLASPRLHSLANQDRIRAESRRSRGPTSDRACGCESERRRRRRTKHCSCSSGETPSEG